MDEVTVSSATTITLTLKDLRWALGGLFGAIGALLLIVYRLHRAQLNNRIQALQKDVNTRNTSILDNLQDIAEEVEKIQKQVESMNVSLAIVKDRQERE